MHLHVDRWLEMSLSWFDPSRIDEQATELIDRVQSLYASTTGAVGLVLECSMRADLITDWTGDTAQPLPFRTPLLQAWQSCTYADLRRLIALLKATAKARGIEDLKIGTMVMLIGDLQDEHIYTIGSAFYHRHRELFFDMPPFSPNYDPRVPLHADDYPYVTSPDGIREGTSFAALFGAQWGVVSAYLGLDLLLLRDHCFGPMLYRREGPYGKTASSNPAEVASWTTAITDVVRQLKTHAPDTLIFGYSAANSAVAEWRVGCVDVESVIADGALDGWIDQTWGGAWQDWWSWDTLGWTFQLANLLTHGAIIASANTRRETPCKHYHLIETWDAWEPWDTLHQVPGKLRWAMWAFAHAAVKTPHGLKVTDGVYLSWVNNREGELWSEDDVRFLGDTLNAAAHSAMQLTEVYGPTIAYNRPMLEWLSTTHPEWNVTEWVDDQAGMLMKWGTPILSATRMEWLAKTDANAYLCQTPGQLDPAVRDLLLTRAQAGTPVVLVGRADVIDPTLLDAVGVSVAGPVHPAGFTRSTNLVGADDLARYNKLFLPQAAPVAASGASLFTTELSPLVVASDSAPVLYWQPQDWYEPTSPVLRRCQLGSFTPYTIVARWLNAAGACPSVSVADLPFELTATVHCWRSGGDVYLLVGNLETGATGDSRLPRTVRVSLGLKSCALPKMAYELQATDNTTRIAPSVITDDRVQFDISIGPNDSGVYRVCGAP